MPSIDIPGYGEALAANATALGVLQVADTSKYWVAAEAWLTNSDGTHQKVRITEITDATHMKAAPLADSGSNVNTLSYAMGGNLAAFTLAKTSRIDMPGQTVRIDSAYNRRTGV